MWKWHDFFKTLLEIHTEIFINEMTFALKEKKVERIDETNLVKC